jgi:hypothetical protein
LPETAEDLAEFSDWQLREASSEEVVVVKPLTRGGYIGIEVRRSGKPGSRFASRFLLILVGRRGYVLTVTAADDELDSPTVDRFFESFRLLDEP